MGPVRADGLRLDAGTRLLFLDMDAVETVHNVVPRVMTAIKHPDNPPTALGGNPRVGFGASGTLGVALRHLRRGRPALQVLVPRDRSEHGALVGHRVCV